MSIFQEYGAFKGNNSDWGYFKKKEFDLSGSKFFLLTVALIF